MSVDNVHHYVQIQRRSYDGVFGVQCDVDGRENDVPFGFTLLCFIEFSFLYCDICV